MSAHIPTATIVLCLSLVLAACSSKDEQSEASSATPLHRKIPNTAGQPADPTADMALAVAENKKDDVRVKYDLNRKPQAGQPLEIDVAVIFDTDSKGAVMSFAGMAGLRISDQSDRAIPALKAGQSDQQKLTVTPIENGIYYVSASVKTDSSSGATAHTFWIPMVVSAAAAPPSATLTGGAGSAGKP